MDLVSDSFGQFPAGVKLRKSVRDKIACEF